jgi:hypothetical protein
LKLILCSFVAKDKGKKPNVKKLWGEGGYDQQAPAYYGLGTTIQKTRAAMRTVGVEEKESEVAEEIEDFGDPLEGFLVGRMFEIYHFVANSDIGPRATGASDKS